MKKSLKPNGCRDHRGNLESGRSSRFPDRERPPPTIITNRNEICSRTTLVKLHLINCVASGNSGGCVVCLARACSCDPD